MQRGFTLIELLVVVLIIGILSAIALPQYNTAVEKSRMAEAFTNARVIIDSMNRAINERPNEYPNTRASLDVRLSGGTWNKSANVYTTDLFMYDLSKGDRLEITRKLGGKESYLLTYFNNLSKFPDEKNCTPSGGSSAEKLCVAFKAAMEY